MSKFSLGRREFALGAAAAATAALVNPIDALGQPPTGVVPAAPEPALSDQEAQSALAKLAPAARAEVEMKINNIFRKYGDRLNDEQKADIRRAMAEGQDSLEKMRAYALDNSDQPATVFQLFHREGKR
jgi:hypothetical protein